MEVYQPDSDIELNRAVFYLGANWCGPCKRFKPEYQEFASDMSEDFEVKFYYIDVDTFASPSSLLTKEVETIKSIPTVLCFLNNKMVEKISPWNKDKLYTAMHTHYVEGEPIDTSRYAVIPNRVPTQPGGEFSSSDEEDEFDVPSCDMESCEGEVIELAEFSKLTIPKYIVNANDVKLTLPDAEGEVEP